MTIVRFFKKIASKTTRAAQIVLLPVLLTLLYFVGFGLFALVGRWLEREVTHKGRINKNSAWHFPQTGDGSDRDYLRQS